MWDNILKPAFVLFLVCAIVAGTLAAVYSMTEETIKQAIKAEEEMARKEVLPGADSFKKIDIKDDSGLVTKAYKGFKGKNEVGYVFFVKSNGYGGDISMSVGIGTDGKLIGVKIGQQNETPGLGTRAQEPKFISQFSGFIPKEPLKVVKGTKRKKEEIQAITGATITSKAVTIGVQAAIEEARRILKKKNNIQGLSSATINPKKKHKKLPKLKGDGK